MSRSRAQSAPAGFPVGRVAEATGETGVLFGGLRNLAWIADRRGDGEQAVRLQSRALEVAASIDERATALALHDVGTFLASAGRKLEAREALHLAAERARAIAYESLEMDALASVGRLDLYARDFDAADRSFSLVFAGGHARELAQQGQRVGAAYAALGLDRREEARGDFTDAAERMIEAGMTSHYDFSCALAGIALAADLADARRAGRLHGATRRLRERSEFRLNADDDDLERFFEQPFIEALGMVAWKQEQAAGAALTLNDAIALARSLAAGSNATTCPTEIVKTAAVVPASDEHSHGGPVSPPLSPLPPSR